MIRQSTIDKLHEMRLSAMADAFENQCAAAATGIRNWLFLHCL